ncbi:MAG: hypothetical protein ACRDRJ_13365 [Streptosporangiaceae bacterium]
MEGYLPSSAEVGWLLAQVGQHPARLVEPPPRSNAWLAYWDCTDRSGENRGSMLH